MPTNQPTPPGARQKFSFGKPTGVKVSFEMGFFSWESDGQTRSEALQAAVENGIFPILLQGHYARHRRERNKIKEDPAQRTYC
jgi:hypothetical protein